MELINGNAVKSVSRKKIYLWQKKQKFYTYTNLACGYLIVQFDFEIIKSLKTSKTAMSQQNGSIVQKHYKTV